MTVLGKINNRAIDKVNTAPKPQRNSRGRQASGSIFAKRICIGQHRRLSFDQNFNLEQN